ncbi:MAG: ParB/RepB/Spo0J family partition protein [Propionibacteriaceae bacterium]|jgi:ParB family chromosome partitioning protein|nr:ParB/RepB/Spo0J family partition protein [Propionibacteriaceae bacterium]
MSAARTRTGLGRGLGDLLQRTDPALAPGGNLAQPPAGARFEEIPLEAIGPNPKQPRTVFDEESLNELAESIKAVGLLQPIVVRPLPDGKYELVMGERRFRAAQLAALRSIPAIVRRTQDHDLLRDALLENLHRVQLNPLEEAAAYQQMLSDFGCTQDELARRVKRSRPQISNTIRLLSLPSSVQRRVAAGVLSAGHARALLGLADAAAMEILASRIVAEGLSVRSTEELVTLGIPTPKRRAQRAAAARSAELDAIAARLSERLDTRVKISGSAKRGRIVVDFSGQDDLGRIVELLPDK